MAVLLAHQAVTNPATVVGSAVNVGRFDVAYVEVYHAFNEGAANTNGQSILIQTSVSDSGNLDWLTAVEFSPVEGITPADEVCTVTEPVGETVIAVAATAGFASEGLIYIRDTVLTDSEWAIVASIVTNTSVTVIDGLTTAHALTTTSLFASAEKFTNRVNVKGVQRIRCVYQNQGATAANTAVQAVVQLIETGN